MSWTKVLLSQEAAAVWAAILLLYVLGVIIHRLYFSPIAKFPGPKLAAVTFWYEFYFDVVLQGHYTWRIREMHRKYGPIVRINPYELHIDDPAFYDEMYTSPSKKCDKWEWSTRMHANHLSIISTVPHDLHCLRKAALSPYFSKKSLLHLEPAIQSLVGTLCGRIREVQRSTEPLNLGLAYSALATDIITQYCFGKSYNFLAKPDFGSEWPLVLMGVARMTPLLKQFSWLYPIMQAMPTWLVALTNPQMMQLIKFRNNITSQMQEILDGKGGSVKSADHAIIFRELLDSSLPLAEKSLERLVHEGETVVGAGVLTITRVLTATSFHILANPRIYHQLKSELTSAIPKLGTLIPLQELEQLPYLSAVVFEGLRISHAASSRLPRVSPDSSIPFREWAIPPGTPVSTTALFTHENPGIFSEPHEFKPDRWLRANQEERLHRYLLPFGRGTRACVGMNLAYAELYLTLAAVFREFNMQLYKTTREDVDIAHDFFHASPRLDSKGVRVLVK